MRHRAWLAGALAAAAATSLQPVTAGAQEREGARTRAVGGVPALPGSWPSMAALYLTGNQLPICGGTLIDSEWVLTAAHCVVRQTGLNQFTPFPTNALSVLVGTNDLTVGGRRIAVRQIIPHERYTVDPDRNDNINDIALLRLAQPATGLPRKLLAREVDAQSLLRDGQAATTMGYGITVEVPSSITRDEMLKLPRSLRLVQADPPIVSRTKCLSVYPKIVSPIAGRSDVAFCAGLDEGKVDSCPGDSGGPIVVRHPQYAQAIQVGIVSYGIGCGLPMRWGVYASVPHYEGWIRQRVPNASFAQLRHNPNDTAPDPIAPLEQLVAPQVSTPPSHSGQVHIDVVVGTEPAERVAVGRVYRVRVTSSIGGPLIILARDEKGQVDMLFPNRRSDGSRLGQTERDIPPGATIHFPALQGQSDGIVLIAGNPPGVNEVIAIVLAAGVRVEDVVEPYESRRTGLRSIPDVATFARTLAGRIRDLEALQKNAAVRAMGTRRFEIVPR